MSTLPLGQRREALRLLGLQDPVEPSEVMSAYRGLARQHHPDHGGDLDAFRSLTMARDQLLADARSGPGVSARSTAGRSVTVQQRASRRFLRGLRRRFARKEGEHRHLD